MKSMWMGLALCIATNTALGLDNSTEYYYHLPEEILRLSDEEKQSDLPMAYQIKDKKYIVLASEVAKLLLDNLRYPNAFEDKETAIKLFQKDLNDPTTGVLSVGQFYLLSKRSAFLNQSKADIAPLSIGLTSHKDKYGKGYANVKGTLTILDEEIAYPINSVEITCHKDEGYCEYLQLNLQDSVNFDSFANSFGETTYISTYKTTYRIIDWSEDEIIAKPFDSSGPACRNEVLTLNFATDEFIMTSTNKNNENEVCKDILMEHPRVSQIVEGYPELNKRNKQKREAAEKFYYSGYRTKVSELLEALKAKLE